MMCVGVTLWVKGSRSVSHEDSVKGAPKEGTQLFNGRDEEIRIQGSQAIDEDRTREYHYY